MNCNYCKENHNISDLTKVGKNVYACDICQKGLETCPTCKSTSVSSGVCLVCGAAFDENYSNHKPFIYGGVLQRLCECGEMTCNYLGRDEIFICENELQTVIRDDGGCFLLDLAQFQTLVSQRRQELFVWDEVDTINVGICFSPPPVSINFV